VKSAINLVRRRPTFEESEGKESVNCDDTRNVIFSKKLNQLDVVCECADVLCYPDLWTHVEVMPINTHII